MTTRSEAMVNGGSSDQISSGNTATLRPRVRWKLSRTGSWSMRCPRMNHRTGDAIGHRRGSSTWGIGGRSRRGARRHQGGGPRASAEGRGWTDRFDSAEARRANVASTSSLGGDSMPSTMSGTRTTLCVVDEIDPRLPSENLASFLDNPRQRVRRREMGAIEERCQLPKGSCVVRVFHCVIVSDVRPTSIVGRGPRDRRSSKPVLAKRTVFGYSPYRALDKERDRLGVEPIVGLSRSGRFTRGIHEVSTRWCVRARFVVGDRELQFGLGRRESNRAVRRQRVCPAIPRQRVRVAARWATEESSLSARSCPRLGCTPPWDLLSGTRSRWGSRR